MKKNIQLNLSVIEMKLIVALINSLLVEWLKSGLPNTSVHFEP